MSFSSSATAKKYYWDFGNGYKVGEKDTTLTFSIIGDYLIKLKTENNFGCIEEVQINYPVRFTPIDTTIVSDNFSSNNIFDIYPIPVTVGNDLMIKNDFTSLKDIQVIIYNYQGLILYDQQISTSKDYPISLATKEMANGVYLLKIQTLNGVFVKKILVTVIKQ